MNEEEKGGAQEVAPAEETPKPQEESGGVPEPEEEMSEEARKAYEGKSPEELAKMHHGLSKKLGKQGAELGEQKTLNESLKDLVKEMRNKNEREEKQTVPNPFQPSYEQPQEVAPQVSQEEVMADDDYLTVGGLKKIQKKRDQETQQQKYYDLTQKTSRAFEDGVKTMGDDPIFKGIENEVKQHMVGSYQPAFQYFGVDVSPELRNPARWRAAAIQVLADRNEWDKITPPKASPVRPVATEIPSSARTSPSERPPVELDMRDRDLADFNDAMASVTGKQPMKKDIEEIVKRGEECMVTNTSFDEIKKRLE